MSCVVFNIFPPFKGFGSWLLMWSTWSWISCLLQDLHKGYPVSRVHKGWRDRGIFLCVFLVVLLKIRLHLIRQVQPCSQSTMGRNILLHPGTCLLYVRWSVHFVEFKISFNSESCTRYCASGTDADSTVSWEDYCTHETGTWEKNVRKMESRAKYLDTSSFYSLLSFFSVSFCPHFLTSSVSFLPSLSPSLSCLLACLLS